VLSAVIAHSQAWQHTRSDIVKGGAFVFLNVSRCWMQKQHAACRPPSWTMGVSRVCSCTRVGCVCVSCIHTFRVCLCMRRHACAS